MAKTLSYFKWQPLLLMESHQNFGKTLRKTNYSPEIYQVKLVSTETRHATNKSIEWSPYNLTQYWKYSEQEETHQTLLDLRIKKQQWLSRNNDNAIKIVDGNINDSIRRSLKILLFHVHWPTKKGVGKSGKILDIWENQNGRVHAHMEMGESEKKLSGMKHHSPNMKI